ncbi:DNA repair protein RecO [Winogradskyella sp. DF17]|uniref:DNA repair protein RecO n=1 Tax=Winogradskyella pelagia TaxID=2819984 RepID=A0ABS3T7Y0_9FLAO|nr:DNA repair protein RecO [Winogradskyella sp. DF17]MBO3118001.1 DNA repair protein RecO [Winogradskyella sp. DF17]
MLTKNKCIVLSKLKYGESDLIVKCFTKERGLVSYILKGVLKSKKSSSKVVYFQPLTQLVVEENFYPKRTLHHFKEVKPYYIYKSLHSNIFKSAIVLFLSEILANTINEEEKNEGLYTFIETALQYLDAEGDYANFHLLFLLKLTRYLGFQPEQETHKSTFFNLQSGIFENTDYGLYSISGHNLYLLKRLLGINFDDLKEVKINSEQRQSFLNMILFYFELHLEGFKKPKSLKVLNDVFH